MFGFPLPEFVMLVLGFGFLIFVHELGHFAVAKWVGVRCPQFAIGFGHALFSWRKGIGFMRGSTEKEYERRCVEKLKADGVKPEAKGPHTGTARYDTDVVKEEHDSEYTARQMYAVGDALGLGETEYRLNYLPLGGYVKMMGQEDMDPNAKSDHPNAYNNKPIWARSCVISAGVVMNIIFGAVFLAAAFMMGVEFPSATVGGVIKTMPAATTYADGHDGDPRYLGLQEGDVILSIDGEKPEDFKDVQISSALASSDSTIELIVQRRGEADPLTYHLPLKRAKDEEKLLSIGVEPGPSLNISYDKDAKGDLVKWLNERMQVLAPEQRTRGKGIRITAVNGQPIQAYPEYLLAFDHSGGEPVSVTFTDQSDGTSASFDVPAAPSLVRDPQVSDNLLGLVPAGKVVIVTGSEQDNARREKNEQDKIKPSPAALAGLKEGDLLIEFEDSKYFNEFMGITLSIQDESKDGYRFVVLRDGKRVDLGKIKPDKDNKFGIVVQPAYESPVIALVLDDTPAQALNQPDSFMPGTTITKVNGVAVANWTQVQQQLLAAVNGAESPESVTLTVVPPVAGAAPEDVVIKLGDKDRIALRSAGWQPDHDAYSPLTEFILLKADGLGEALMIGVDKSQDFVLQTYITLLRLIQGDVKLSNLRGPVGIAQTGTQVAEQGVAYLLFFLGLISINLAVINFLPIPIVDGGHMVFLLWEKITGKPPSEKVQVASLYAGLAVIGFVFIATFYFDVVRLFS